MLSIENKIEINRHKVIEERGMHFADILNGEERECVLSIVEKSKEFFKHLGEKDNVVYNPTGKEWAVFKTAVKRYVRTDFIEPALTRLKKVSTSLNDIEGICNECIRHLSLIDDGEHEMCNDCEIKMMFRLSIYNIQWERERMIESDFCTAVEKTKFPDELIGNWMLLANKMRKEKESKHIDKALKEFIRDELMNEFINQNKQLLKKYQLWQNQ